MQLFGKISAKYGLVILWIVSNTLMAQTDESKYYIITDVPVPEQVVLEVGGLAFDEDGNLAVATRRGEIWMIENPGSASPRFSRWAEGLHEPLGLAYRDGAFFTAQRGELTKIVDRNQDGKADRFERIFKRELAGNYHEYTYGPHILPDGNMLITLNLGWIGRGASLAEWGGWMLMISPEGKVTPLATGMRSPAGFGVNAAGDVFYTENQGDWVGSGRMTHIEKGDFVGHPEGLRWSSENGSPLALKMSDIRDEEEQTLFEYAKITQELKPPSVWFPHTLMGISTSDIEVIPPSWIPFAGQLLVGDQGHSKIMRVYQEKINGVYQGICFPFREGFSSGVLRMEWAPDDMLYVGMTNRGWASTGKAPFGLQRLAWSGQSPFEIQKVNIQPDGFLLTFTEPVQKSTASDPTAYQITDFNYLYHHHYGSPAIQTENRSISRAEVSDDGMQVRLYLDKLRPGFINEIDASGVQNRAGRSLLHSKGYYTINEIPGGGSMEKHAEHQADGISTVDLNSPKRPTTMPSNWFNGPDQSITIGTKPGMLFDTESITVKAGSKIKLELNNPDDMMHNLVIVKPGTIDRVARDAIALGIQGHNMGYVPDTDDVLFHTNLLGPNSADVIYFVAPDKPGRYDFVCTFPAHAATMRGVMNVE